MRLLYLLSAVVCMLQGCRKTGEIGKTMQPAIDNAQAFQAIAAHSFVPVAFVLWDWRNSKAIPFILNTDSGVWFDYKNGLLCPDGLIRKGKCLVNTNIGFSMNGFNDTILFSASPADSFAVMSSNGPVYFSGKLKFISFSAYSILINGKADIRTLNKQSSIGIDGLIELYPKGQTTRSAKFKTRWNAYAFITGGEVYHYDVTRDSFCFPCFSIGKGNNFTHSVSVDFNPFGNAACDPVVKFTYGREEWLEDLW